MNWRSPEENGKQAPLPCATSGTGEGSLLSIVFGGTEVMKHSVVNLFFGKGR